MPGHIVVVQRAPEWDLRPQDEHILFLMHQHYLQATNTVRSFAFRSEHLVSSWSTLGQDLNDVFDPSTHIFTDILFSEVIVAMG